MGLTITTLSKSDVVAGQKLYAANETTRIDAINDNFSDINDKAVLKEDAQTIAGVKTFSSFPVTPSSAPTTNYQAANKKYVDDQITANAEAMGSYATDDDEGNAMLVAHAYLANQDGYVLVNGEVGPSGGASDLKGYVDTDDNPASGGTVMAQEYEGVYASDGDKHSIMFPVASGEYFEITVSNYDSVTIIWRAAHGTLVKCTDQD